jgi:DNA-binding NtrC family response regulator
MAKILLIDDEDDLRAFVAIALNYHGHEVTQARSGRVITDPPKGGMAASEFDLIITDIVMPDSEGLETIIAARKAHPAGKIIAIPAEAAVRPAPVPTTCSKRAYWAPMPRSASLFPRPICSEPSSRRCMQPERWR